MLDAIHTCMNMLSASLNNKIVKLAPQFVAKDIAPSTFGELTANTTSGLVVWSGASDQTIYGDATVNHAMRAWHDSIHLALGAGFDTAGETRVALEQARLIGSDVMGDIIMAEVQGQVEYYNKYGHFPVDQVLFIKNYMKGII